MATMGERLQAARIAAGYSSAAKAAEAFGIPASTYRSHENGQNEFSADDAKRYGKKFKVSPGYLLTGDKDSTEEIGDSATGMTVSSVNGLTNIDGGDIPEIDLVAGLGGGGIAATEISSHRGISFAAEVVRTSWRVPEWVLHKLNAKPHHIACFPCQGDSMWPTVDDGDVVFVDTRHRVPSPPAIYALADQWGGIVVKRLEIVSGPRDDTVKVRVSSDNEKYLPQEVTLDEIFIVGRYIGRFAF